MLDAINEIINDLEDRGDLESASTLHNVFMRVAGIEEGNPYHMSTRVPTAKGSTEDPLRELLIGDFATMQRDPALLEKAMKRIREYPGFKNLELPEVIDQMKRNLVWNYNEVPEEMRDESQHWYEGAHDIAQGHADAFKATLPQSAGVLAVLSPQKDWYQNVSLAERMWDIFTNHGSHRWDDVMERAAEDTLRSASPGARQQIMDYLRGRAFHEISDSDYLELDDSAGDQLEAPAIEVNSPGKKSRRKTLLDADQLRARWMRAYDEAHNPRGYRSINPRGEVGDWVAGASGPSKLPWSDYLSIGKALRIMRDGSPESIHEALGTEHKVRNFNNNIVDPSAPWAVTMDTHAVAADTLSPLGGEAQQVKDNFGASGGNSLLGISGTYPIHHEAYTQAANELGVLPRALQSITWDGVRTLFPKSTKRKLQPLVEDIWRRKDEGEINHAQALEAIHQLAGGFRMPEWQSDRGVSNPYQRGKSTYLDRRIFSSINSVITRLEDEGNVRTASVLHDAFVRAYGL